MYMTVKIRILTLCEPGICFWVYDVIYVRYLHIHMYIITLERVICFKDYYQSLRLV